MIVTERDLFGTIGGGRLEYRALRLARALLREGAPARTKEFPLGPELGQCCGGQVALHFQRIAGEDRAWLDPLRRWIAEGREAALVFGRDDASGRRLAVSAGEMAGDLGARTPAALRAARSSLVLPPLAGEARWGSASTLGGGRSRAARPPSNLPPQAGEGFATPPAGKSIDALVSEEGWIVVRVSPPDCVVYLFGAGHVGRALAAILGQLPCRAVWIDERKDAFPPAVPANVATLRAGDPATEAARAPKGAYILVMTHSHARDQAIVEAVLRRGDFAYLGLIGSATKRARFAARLRAAGIGEAALARLVCPIGAEGIPGKEPGVIALAAATEIMRRHRAAAGKLARSA